VKLVIRTSVGTFSVYQTSGDQLILYEGDGYNSSAVIDPIVRRRAVHDLSIDGIAKAAIDWLESNYSRVEVESVTVHKCGLNGKGERK